MNSKNTPQITPENYEEYLILLLDGELSSEDEAVLQTFLVAHPALAETVADYEAVKIPLPETLPFFEGKESLLKPEVEVSRKTISFRPFLWAAAALLLLWVGIRFLPTGEVPSQIAVENPPVKMVSPKPQTQVKQQEPVALSQPQKTGEKSSSKPLFQARKNPVVVVPHEEILVADAPVKEVVSPLPFQQKTPALLPLNPAPPEVAKEVAVNISQPEKMPSSGVSVDLPVLQEIRNAAVEKVVALRDAHRSLKATEATVSIGNRELFTIRF